MHVCVLQLDVCERPAGKIKLADTHLLNILCDKDMETTRFTKTFIYIKYFLSQNDPTGGGLV